MKENEGCTLRLKITTWQAAGAVVAESQRYIHLSFHLDQLPIATTLLVEPAPTAQCVC